jgi:hypothetical protein
VANPDLRAPPDRELVDLCRSVMKARIHGRLSCWIGVGTRYATITDLPAVRSIE